MLEGLYILNQAHESILNFVANGSLDPLLVQKLKECKLPENKDDWSHPIELSNSQCVHISKYNKLFLFLPFDSRTPPLLVEEVSKRIIEVLETFFGAKLTANLVFDNRAQIMVILSEMIGTGIPQQTQSNILQQILHKDGIWSQVFGQVGLKRKGTIPSVAEVQLPDQLIEWEKPWRRANVNHVKEEVFIDIIERVSLTAKASKSIRLPNATVHGSIQMISRLSGQPTVKIGIFLDAPKHQIWLHESVNRELFESQSNLVLCPPDGESCIAKYTTKSQGPGSVSAQLKRGSGSFEIILNTAIDTKIDHVRDFVVEIVFPSSCRSVKELSSTTGDLNITNPERCIYRLGSQVPMGWRAQLHAQGLDEDGQPVSPLYIDVHYELKGRSFSSTKLQNISVETSALKSSPFKGVRYQTKLSNLRLA